MSAPNWTAHQSEIYQDLCDDYRYHPRKIELFDTNDSYFTFVNIKLFEGTAWLSETIGKMKRGKEKTKKEKRKASLGQMYLCHYSSNFSTAKLRFNLDQEKEKWKVNAENSKIKSSFNLFSAFSFLLFNLSNIQIEFLKPPILPNPVSITILFSPVPSPPLQTQTTQTRKFETPSPKLPFDCHEKSRKTQENQVLIFLGVWNVHESPNYWIVLELVLHGPKQSKCRFPRLKLRPLLVRQKN